MVEPIEQIARRGYNLSNRIYVPNNELVTPNGRQARQTSGMGRREVLRTLGLGGVAAALAGCAQMRLYRIEEQLRTGGSDIPPLYDEFGDEYTRREANGHVLLTDKEGNSVIYPYPTGLGAR